MLQWDKIKKTYRNKLRHILFQQEKNYYAELLQAHRSNMKKTLVHSESNCK